jgi:hypothetical protein
MIQQSRVKERTMSEILLLKMNILTTQHLINQKAAKSY